MERRRNITVVVILLPIPVLFVVIVVVRNHSSRIKSSSVMRGVCIMEHFGMSMRLYVENVGDSHGEESQITDVESIFSPLFPHFSPHSWSSSLLFVEVSIVQWYCTAHTHIGMCTFCAVIQFICYR